VAPNGTITTAAGNGVAGFSGDGGAAIDAEATPGQLAVDAGENLYFGDGYGYIRKVSPDGTITSIGQRGNPTSGLTFDNAGNLYICDPTHNRILELSVVSGTVTTVAGNGAFRDSGDGGPASIAQMSAPNGLAMDGAGNLYIAASDNHRVRRIANAGVITTIAGTGISGYSGDGRPAIDAQVAYPADVAADAAGNVFIAQPMNYAVRKVSADGTIATFAGNGLFGHSGDGGAATNARLGAPSGIALDAAGNLYIVDGANNRIRKVSPAGIIATVAGNGAAGYSGDGGPAVNAALNISRAPGPYPLLHPAIDSAGTIYFPDAGNHRIRKVTPDGIITTVAGNGIPGYSGDDGPATNAQLNYPEAVAVDAAGNLYITDTFNHRVRRVSTAGIITTIAGNGTIGQTGDGGQAADAPLDSPMGIAIDPLGVIYVSDRDVGVVRKLQPAQRGSSD
jgi:sugar lactone lactonase YvrE